MPDVAHLSSVPCFVYRRSVATYNSYKCLKAVDLENLANNNTILETVLEAAEETETAEQQAAAAQAGKVEQQLQQQQLERQLIESSQKVETGSVSSQGSHASTKVSAISNSQAVNSSQHQTDSSCQEVTNSCQTKSVSSSQQTTFITSTTSHQTTVSQWVVFEFGALLLDG